MRAPRRRIREQGAGIREDGGDADGWADGEYLLVLDTCRQVSKMLPKMQLSAFAGKNVEEKAEKGKN